MGFVTGVDHGERVPLLEDLPDPAGKTVLVRATFDRPMAVDPARPLALRRAQGLAATVDWLLERGARVTVCGDTGAADAVGETARLAVVRRSLEEVSSLAKASDALDVRVITEDVPALRPLVARHQLFVNDTLQDSLLPLPSLVLPAGRLPSAAGRTLQHDLEVLDRFLFDPARPFVAVLGGERSFARLHGVRGLVLRADSVLLGGALALPMLQALGRQPAPQPEGDLVTECRAVMGLSRRVHHAILLPLDLVWRRPDGSVDIAPSDVPGSGEVVDIGPTTRLRFAEALQAAGSVLWAGALGRVEEPELTEGCRAVAATLPDHAPVVLGGDALVGLLGTAELLPASAGLLSATDAAIELLKNGDLAALAALRPH